MEFRLASVAFIVVLATYLFLGGMGDTGFGNQHPRDAAYNLLARGLLQGHLSLDREAPPVLARLSDPYDPAANGAARDPRDRLNDLSYFHGKLYLYFGIAPALFVFIPWHLVTGGWLPHWTAVVLLCSFGLLVNLSLLQAIKLRVFPESKPWILAIGTLVLGFGSYAPLLVARADMWEVPIAFSYLSVSLALRCLWVAFGDPVTSARWIALASAAFGLAFAARPTVLPNAAILLLPFLSRENRRSAAAWAAAVVPVTLCGLGVALYNAERFGNPFDFGMTYQLAGVYVARLHTFSPSYLWTDLGFYLFQGVRWSLIFPFTHEPDLAALRATLPLNHGGVQQISGALFNEPILWAAVAVPLFIRYWRRERRLTLIALSAGWVALSSLVLLSFFYGACSRYQFEFVPAMALLASIGIMAIDCASAGRLGRWARYALVPALLVSCAFPVLYGIERCTTDHNISGITYLAYGDIPAAAREFDDAQFLSPRNPMSRLGTGMMLVLEGRRREAQADLEALVRDFPDYATAHVSLGSLLAQEGHRGEAIWHLREAHRLDPEDAAIDAALAAELKAGK
jgi:tetratricopeptide (TPR) repeat protein